MSKRYGGPIDAQFRVEFVTGRGVEITHRGGVDTDWLFENPDELPEWVKERIALLDVFRGETIDPAKGVIYLTDVGSKMGHIYWIDDPDKKVRVL